MRIKKKKKISVFNFFCEEIEKRKNINKSIFPISFKRNYNSYMNHEININNSRRNKT